MTQHQISIRDEETGYLYPKQILQYFKDHGVTAPDDAPKSITIADEGIFLRAGHLRSEALPASRFSILFPQQGLRKMEQKVKKVYVAFDSWKSIGNTEHGHMADLHWIHEKCKREEDYFEIALLEVPEDIAKNDERLMRKTLSELQSLLEPTERVFTMENIEAFAKKLFSSSQFCMESRMIETEGGFKSESIETYYRASDIRSAFDNLLKGE